MRKTDFTDEIAAVGRQRRRTRRSIVNAYARVWPRDVFDIKAKGRLADEVRKALGPPGVYILYREDVPYYIGKTGRPLFDRIWAHANRPGDRYYAFWDFFSAFTVPQKRHRDEVEGILIAAMPTANSSSPHLPRIELPARIGRLLKRRREVSAIDVLSHLTTRRARREQFRLRRRARAAGAATAGG